ncbi:MAG: hypothetical protein Q8R25_03000 [bacterium]|nr:hypothetical protein [bacterium]
MDKPHQATIDFLSEQLKRREEERVKERDQKIQTHRTNHGTLLATWRFILITRGAFFALAAAGLQYVLQNLGTVLDTTRLITVIETWKGLPTGIIGTARLVTSGQAANLVAITIVSITSIAFAIDVMLAKLQSRCVVLGLDTELHLFVPGLFFDIRNHERVIAVPFWIARFAILAFGIVALSYLLLAR